MEINSPPKDIFHGAYRPVQRSVQIGVYLKDATSEQVERGLVQPLRYETQQRETVLREPIGEMIFQDGDIEIVAPAFTDLPADDAYHLQIVDKSLNTEKLGQTPLLTSDIVPTRLLKSQALAILVEEFLYKSEKHDAVWMNNNWHTTVPALPLDAPIDAQYAYNVVDVHAWRNGANPKNVFRPPLIRGMEGIADWEEGAEVTGDIKDVSPAEIDQNKHDPMTRVENVPILGKVVDQHPWRDQPTGLRDKSGRNKYTVAEVDSLRFLLQTEEFNRRWKAVKDVSLFETDKSDEKYPPEKGDGDAILWSYDGFRLITQKTPMLDSREGIYLQLQLSPKIGVPWDDGVKTLEGYAIVSGIIRFLKNSTSIGKIGDAYIDINNNWVKPLKDRQQAMAERVREINELVRENKLSPEEGRNEEEKVKVVSDGRDINQAKTEFEEASSLKFHIQLEKEGATWDIIPAPGLTGHDTGNHQDIPEKVIAQIKQSLATGFKDGPYEFEGSLKDWLFQFCRGKIFT